MIAFGALEQMARNQDTAGLLLNGAWRVSYSDDGSAMVYCHERPAGVDDVPENKRLAFSADYKVTVLWNDPAETGEAAAEGIEAMEQG